MIRTLRYPLRAAVALLVVGSGGAGAQGASAGERPLGRTAAEQAAMRGTPRRSGLAKQQLFDDSTVVEQKSIRITLPRGFDDEDWSTAASTVGFYAWEIVVDTPAPFTLVLMADTVMRTPVLRDILRASTLRLCPATPPLRLGECVQPIKSRITYDDAVIRVLVSDASFVARVQRERPLVYVRGTIAPRGRVESAEVPWVYRDRKPDPE